MRVPRIYLQQALSGGGEFRLPPATAQRLRDVLRLAVGDALTVFDGRGGEWRARLRALGRDAAMIRTDEFVPAARESPLRTELGMALARGKRSDWALQKAVELGLNVFQPLFSERCEVRDGGPKWRENRLRHWRQTAIHAAEQSGRTALTEVRAPLALRDWLANVDAPCRLLLHPQGGETQAAEAPAGVCLLSGPEGGLDEDELRAARAAGFVDFGLGPRILRSETAPAAALAILQRRWGDGARPP